MSSGQRTGYLCRGELGLIGRSFLQRSPAIVVKLGKLSVGSTSCLIRDFEPDDQTRVREIVLEGLGERFGSIKDSLNPDLDDVLVNYLKAGHQFFVAEEKGVVVGCTGLLKEAHDIYRIVRMSVQKKARQRGVAGALLEHCVKHAVENRGVEVRAFTQPEWRDAVSFYQGHGFVQYGADQIDIYLRKRLALPH